MPARHWAPEISTDGFLPYQNAIRDAFNGRASYGVIVKTYSITNLAVKRRCAPLQLLRMGSRRFTRLINGFSKKLDNHIAAVALYACHYAGCMKPSATSVGGRFRPSRA